ncbi:1316_t:CDS:1, partial [Acaulospora colombiana]
MILEWAGVNLLFEKIAYNLVEKFTRATQFVELCKTVTRNERMDILR